MRLAPPLLFASAFLIAALPLRAQTVVMPFGGYAPGAAYDNGAAFVAEEAATLDTRGGFLVGVGAEVPFFQERLPVGLAARPSLELAFVPSESVSFAGGESIELSQLVFRASGEVIVSFPFFGAVVPSAGLGLSFARYRGAFDASGGAEIVGDDVVTAWAVGPSLVAGLRLERPGVAPFADARYRFATPSPTFSESRPGTELDNGFSVVAGVRIAL